MHSIQKNKKIKVIKAWLYIWPGGDKQILFKRVLKEDSEFLNLREIKVQIKPL